MMQHRLAQQRYLFWLGLPSATGGPLRLVLLLAVCCTVVRGADPVEKPAAVRSYAEGPLTAADFLAPIPDPRPIEHGVELQAQIYPEIQYHYRFDGKLVRGQFEVTLLEVTCIAVIHRTRSWCRKQPPASLLDHEQGHFDLTAYHAAQAQTEVTAWLKAKPVTIRQKTVALADAALNEKIRQHLAPAVAAHAAAQADYDHATEHGTDRVAQRAARVEHHRLLRSLDPLAAADPTAPSATVANPTVPATSGTLPPITADTTGGR